MIITPPRPKVTSDIINQAALYTARNLLGHFNNNLNKLVDAIVTCYQPGDNGYELTKKIEIIDCRFNFNASFVNAMEDMDINVDEIYADVCMQWYQENNIQPPLPVGSMIIEGEITGIADNYPACYLVKEHGQDQNSPTRRIIKFEDAVAVQSSSDERKIDDFGGAQ